eukprot:gb/GFBE01010378.1/.p1 GENE.gb/GFBE01010378.1/~~gb/GFBE01010378.1/.p1  ORF type:complete len:267 (+),score=71.07 gb/GFBE01010378.1/:1-801(+)
MTRTETLQISDGTTMEICRVSDIDDATWAEVKAYVECSPGTAKSLQGFATNSEAVRGWLQTQAIAEHYGRKMKERDVDVQDRVQALEADPELAPVFKDIKRNGMEAAMKYYSDEKLMLKISKKMRGFCSELESVLQQIEDAPLTLHEAAKKGDLRAVQELVKWRKVCLTTHDQKGISALGYALAANHVAVVKLLLSRGANAYTVDNFGNSAVHYAAGYGCEELLEYLLTFCACLNKRNAQGQTPLDVATQNEQTATIQVLRSRGAF